MADTLAESLKKASEVVLNEILREAESRLDAQLTTAIASDTRAMTFLGFLSAIVVAVIGSGLAVFATQPALAGVALLVGVGFSASAGFAFLAARPIDFEMVGNEPESWAFDIDQAKSLHESMAEQVAHYDTMIKSNRAAMAISSKHMARSANIAAATLAIGALLAGSYMAGLLQC